MFAQYSGLARGNAGRWAIPLIINTANRYREQVRTWAKSMYKLKKMHIFTFLVYGVQIVMFLEAPIGRSSPLRSTLFTNLMTVVFMISSSSLRQHNSGGQVSQIFIIGAIFYKGLLQCNERDLEDNHREVTKGTTKVIKEITKVTKGTTKVIKGITDIIGTIYGP